MFYQFEFSCLPSGSVVICRHCHFSFSYLFDTLPFLIVDSEREVFESVFFQRAVLDQRFHSVVDALEQILAAFGDAYAHTDTKDFGVIQHRAEKSKIFAFVFVLTNLTNSL